MVEENNNAAEEVVPSTDVPKTTNIPSANAPDPATANPEVNPNASTEKVTPPAAAKSEPGAAKAAKEKTATAEPGAAKAAKKEKAPAVEDKPFADFIQQDYLPALEAALVKEGISDLKLTFEKQKIQVIGFKGEPECWQVIGRWQGDRRQFYVYFLKEDIQGQRAFSYADTGSKPSILEPFLIDERKITLDLLVFGITQRLNAQKWLVRN